MDCIRIQVPIGAVHMKTRSEFDRSPGLKGILDENAAFDRLARGFRFVEGPVWNPGSQELIFSDIIGNRIYRWSAACGVRVFREPSHMANGNALDREGRLITCEHAESRVTRTETDGTLTVLASHYRGRELNSPNDVVVKRDGMVYFTDPPSGRGPVYGVERPQELAFQGVFRLEPDTGELTLLAADFTFPNGLCFSADERRLLVNDSREQIIREFAVLADGTLGKGRLFARLAPDGEGVADGMKFDSQGNLYCCGPGGIQVFHNDGEYVGVIRTPEKAANLTWGDPDLRALYITASTSVYRLRVLIPGPSIQKAAGSRPQGVADTHQPK
jgi:gluconolactonase